MRAMRGLLEWLAIWIVGSAAALGLLALLAYCKDAFHPRGAGIGGTIYWVGSVAVVLGLIAALVYWALGAETIRGRLLRLLLAGAGMTLLAWFFVGSYLILTPPATTAA
jgi:hypothetical protein